MLLKFDALEAEGWNGFVPGKWQKEVEVRDFIQKNYTPYEGDDTFLAEPTQNTKDLCQCTFPERYERIRRYPYGYEGL